MNPTWPQLAFGSGSYLTLTAMYARHQYIDYRREQKRGVR